MEPFLFDHKSEILYQYPEDHNRSIRLEFLLYFDVIKFFTFKWEIGFSLLFAISPLVFTVLLFVYESNVSIFGLITTYGNHFESSCSEDSAEMLDCTFSVR